MYTKFLKSFYNSTKSPLSFILKAHRVLVLQCKYGELKQVLDDVIKSNVLQIQSINVNACCITCPVNPKGSLGVRMPFLTLLVKNLGQYFTFEITVRNKYNGNSMLASFMLVLVIFKLGKII